jgi:drug/metabolite transporter (DMT)-like permease
VVRAGIIRGDEDSMRTGPRANPYKSPARDPVARRTVKRVAFVALLAGATGIAFAPIFVRLSELGPTATAFYRLALALPILWLWMEIGDRRAATNRPTGYRDFVGLAVSGLFFAGDLGLWHWSIKLTSVANSTLLVNLAPVFVALGAWLFFGERFSTTFLIGLVVAIVGAALLVGGSPQIGADHLLGDVLAVAAAVSYAGYILAVSRLRARFSTAAVMAYGGGVTCAALLLVALVSGENLIASSAYGWAMLLGVALVSQVGGQSLITYALAHLPSAFSSVSLLLQPVAAAVLAWVILGEALGAWQGLGGAVVLVGIVLARRGGGKPA